MEKMSITEALAEIKLIDKKIDKKNGTIEAHLYRFEHIKDPFEAEEGGSAGMVAREFQSIGDHYARLVRIRAAIAKANLETALTVEGETRSIYAWLVWKREVFLRAKNTYERAISSVLAQMKTTSERPMTHKNDAGEQILVRTTYHVKTKELGLVVEKMLTISERLDGLLSLKNATIQIEF